MYGLLFTISAYGIIGFLYELLTTIYKRKKSVKTIIKNIILFLVVEEKTITEMKIPSTILLQC